LPLHHVGDRGLVTAEEEEARDHLTHPCLANLRDPRPSTFDLLEQRVFMRDCRSFMGRPDR
jgi:hypothetical protein